MRIVDFMNVAGMTIAICQGNDIHPKMRIEEFKTGGRVFRAGRCEVRNSISDRLQLFMEVLNADIVPTGEIEEYTVA